MKAHAVAAVAALTLAGLIVRIAIAFNGGLWRDEALFLGVVALPSWGAMLDFLRYHESHPPLFYALMRGWLALFGRSDSAALALPLVFGAMLVPATYIVGASIFRERTGLLAAAFVAFAPRLTEFAAMVRPYSFLALAILFSMWALVRGLESGGARSWSLYACSVLVMILTHNWAWLVVVAQCVAVLSLMVRRAQYRREATAFAVAAGFSILAYLPWLPALLDQVRGAGHSPLPTEGFAGVIALMLYALVAVMNATLMSAAESPRWVGVVVIVIAIAMIIWGRTTRSTRPVASRGGIERRQPASMLFFTTFAGTVLIAIAISPRTSMLVGACLSTLAPLVLLLLSEQAVCFAERTASDSARTRLGVVLAAGFTLASSYAFGLHDLLVYPRANTREVVVRLRAEQRADDLLMILPGWLASSVNHYDPGVASQTAFPDSGRSRLFDFSRLYERMSDSSALARARSRIAEAAQRGGRVWLVTDLDPRDSVDAADRTYAETHRVAGRMGRVRAADVQSYLRAEFGPPLRTIRTEAATPAWEEIFAELYAKVTPDTSTTRDP